MLDWTGDMTFEDVLIADCKLVFVFPDGRRVHFHRTP